MADHAQRSLAAVMLLVLSACSQASDGLSAWPSQGTGSSGSGAGQSSSSLPGSSASDAQSSKDVSEAASTSSAVEDPGSWTLSDAATPTQADSSTAPESDTSSSSGSCVPELCFEMNPKGPIAGTRWRLAEHTFPIQLIRKSLRVVRIELMEGFAQGTTTVRVSKPRGNGVGGGADIISTVKWDIDLPDRKEWVGADLEPPLHLKKGKVVWLRVTPVPGSMASVATKGQETSLWYRPPGSSRWTKAPAPVMFRAYCCAED